VNFRVRIAGHRKPTPGDRAVVVDAALAGGDKGRVGGDRVVDRDAGRVGVADVADGFLATILGLVLMEIAVKSSPSGSEAFTLSLLLSVFNLADAVSDYFGALLYDSYTASFFFHLVWINAAGTAATALIAPSLMRWIGSK